MAKLEGGQGVSACACDMGLSGGAAGGGAEPLPASRAQEVSALYIHMPFCKGRCAYCAFPTSTLAADDPIIAAYASGLVLQLRRCAAAGLLSRLETTYIGGGTPSHVGSKGLTGVLYALAGLVQRREDSFELTCECNPESVSPALARDLYALGVNRFSLGVQALDDGLLATLGRPHAADDARRAVAALMERGARCSVDLICGIPGQTRDGFLRDVREAAALGVEHVSVYALSVEEGALLQQAVARGELLPADDDEQAQMMIDAADALGSCGFGRYEVASYAKPGCECKHNIAYWTGRGYIGLGVGAASMLCVQDFLKATEAGVFRPRGNSSLACADGGAPYRVRLSWALDGVGVRERTLAAVREFAKSGVASVEVECLSRREAAAEDIMLGMRLARGVDEGSLREAAGLLPGLEGVLEGLCEDGLARWVAGEPCGGPSVEQSGGPIVEPGAGPCGGPSTGPSTAPSAELRGGLSNALGARRLAPTQRGWLLGNEMYGRLWGLASKD